MSEGDTATLRKAASDNKGKLAVGGVSAATLFAVWQMFIQPMQETHRTQWRRIAELNSAHSALSTAVTKLETKVELLLQSRFGQTQPLMPGTYTLPGLPPVEWETNLWVINPAKDHP